MDIFHYLAYKLKDMALFESTIVELTERTGAIYNDFDNEEPFAHYSDDASSFSFSQTVDLEIVRAEDDNALPISQSDVDYDVAHIHSKRRINSDDEET